jgi:anti-anti-sigma regulatory factor
LITTLNVNALTDTMASELPGQGVPSCYLALFEDPKPYQYPDPAPEWARLILAYDPRGRTQLDWPGQRFPARRLIPDELWPQDRACSFVLLSLHFQEEQIGFVLFESGSRKGRMYETLGTQISSALKGALLLRAREEADAALERAYAEVEQQVRERTAELQREITKREQAQAESARLQQEVIEAQQRVIRELSTPVIPVVEGVIIMPLIGSIDTLRARDITRALLAGISQYHAKVVILDVTGVPLVDSGVANHLNKTVQTARLKGARTIITGVSEAVAEAIVDLGVDWSGIATMSDLQTGLRAAMTDQLAWRRKELK